MQVIEYDFRQPWEDLANGIIIRATDDYKMALSRLQEQIPYKAKLNYAREIHSLNRWFRGKWFETLTSTDPEYIIENLNNIYGNTETKNFVNRTTVYDKERI